VHWRGSKNLLAPGAATPRCPEKCREEGKKNIEQIERETEKAKKEPAATKKGSRSFVTIGRQTNSGEGRGGEKVLSRELTKKEGSFT